MKDHTDRRQELFNYVADEFKVLLLESDIDEIERIILGSPKQSLLSRFMGWVKSLDIYVPAFPVFE